MSTPKRSRVSNLRRSLTHVRQLPKHFMAWLLRLIFAGARFSRTNQAGFILPTTVMLLLVLTLTVGGLSFRSFSRLNQTIAYREQQSIDNFAVPAVDRAKAKIEFLFTKDKAIIDKRPPSSTDLVNALLAKSGTWGDADHSEQDPYTLPDETQLDINGDGNPDPAWSFPSDDGSLIVYSLLTSHQGTDSGGNDITLSSNETEEKANALVTRNGPINTQRSAEGCPVSILSGDGWQDAGSNLQKNFQIDVLTITNPNSPNRTVHSAEYQQVRSTPKGNKYGAWFRYDMEIFPGEVFRWNGAMHSESNIITSQGLEAYLVSSPESCVFSTDASEITLSLSGYDTNGDGNDDTFFQGHLVSGASRDDSFGGGTDFHDENNGNPANPGIDRLRINTDSVNEGAAFLTDVAVDPVLILTEDVTANLDPGDWAPEAGKDAIADIANDRLLTNSARVRVFPDATRPFVDDGFRADNRYGPKPRYDALNSLTQANSETNNVSHVIGDVINDNPLLASDNPAEQEYGLDGYWERRSVAQGLRVIVGQRLELGNRLGWEADDPLYPPTTVQAITDKGAAQAKQQKSLRDNLAAVQGMVAYHYTQDDGELPYICMASTVHPGTEQTLANSRTFGTYPQTAANRIDFLTGNGTNGWEFDFQGRYATSAAFSAAVMPDQPLGRALRNLAHFAGDPQGGAPSFPPVQGIQGDAVGPILDPDDDFVHPYPYLSMWGDFSILRRILFEHNYLNGIETDLVDTLAKYDALSPADKSTLHSAACTLGMLADNIEKLKAEYNLLQADPVVAAIEAALPTPLGSPKQAKEWLNNELAMRLSADDLEKAKLIALYRQVIRDRTYGFATGVAPTDCATDFPGSPKLVGAFCSSSQNPAYPSLYYLFPVLDHNQNGSLVAGVPGGPLGSVAATQTDEYNTEGLAADRYIFDDVTPGNIRVNSEVVYAVIDPANALDPTDLSNLALAPANTVADFQQPTENIAAPEADIRDELQRSTINVGGTTFNVDGNLHQLTFLDKAMMDGRELLSTRVLNLDIEKLTQITADASSFFMDGPDQVAWLPEVDGIFYAAREDAVREDSIVRPRRADWATCGDFANLVDNGQNCPMVVANPADASQRGTSDPPLADNLISPKPVDMYADPDRRPNGFRLINGSIIYRSADDKAAGVTFVTDNTAYIYGDFNLHQDAAGNILEEFQTKLGIDFATGLGNPFNDFYGRTNLDADFARGGQDLWRPSEIFADAVGILSSEFRDGWVEDAYIYETDGAEGTAAVSSAYLNSDRPRKGTNARQADDWQREDLAATQGDTDVTLPIWFDRNGRVFKAQDEADLGSPYTEFPTTFGGANANQIGLNEKLERQRNLITAADNTRVNALLVSGIVPLRSGQNYGGLHNFPRLLEYWPGKNLFISGGFFQLNFSTQATAPFDQDAWEPGANPNGAQVDNGFYGAATRIWGYDVAFQYTSVAPIARRFITFGRPRSEFYRELPLNDEYIANLCTARNNAGDLELGADVGCQ
ncbi:hormogonium polysaccharide biosynthesis protein HpsA [Leptothoe sp. EHU-05/26/07-4]